MQEGKDRKIERINTEEELEQNVGMLKMEINNLIWMYAPGSVTLNDADKMSNEILKIIRNGIYHKEES